MHTCKIFIHILILLLVIQTKLVAQYHIAGYVKDSATGEVLIGATVQENNKGTGAITNNYGYFSLKTNSDSVLLTTSYIGYQQETVSVKTDKNLVTIYLTCGQNIEEITVVAQQKRNDVSIIEIPVKSVALTPSFMGETNLMKTAQLLPGILPGSEGSSAIYVRGGSPDQNLVLIDDAHVYRLEHFGGVFSIINSDALNNVTLYKGSFPARYGGRLSSVVDIHMRDGNMQEYKFKGSIGMMSCKLLAEGPLIKNKSSLLVSARRSTLDLLTSAISAVQNESNYGNGFYDLNVKANYIASKKNRYYASYYRGNDKVFANNLEKQSSISQTTDMKTNWGNELSTLRWNHVYGKRAFSNVTLLYTNYDLIYSSKAQDSDLSMNSTKFNSGITDIGAKVDVELYGNHRYNLKFGGGYLFHRFDPGTTSFYSHSEYDTISEKYQSNIDITWEYNAYMEQNISLKNTFQANLGLRYTRYIAVGNKYNSIEPRVLLTYNVLPNFIVNAAYTQMTQFIHLLANTGIGMPTDLWIPAGPNAAPEKSALYSLGGKYTFKEPKVSLSVDGYYKTMTNLIEYSEGSSFFSSGDWTTKTETGGTGKVYGFELLVQKNSGNVTGWIGYGLSKNTRNFRTINNGEDYYFRYDRRHECKFLVNWQYSKRSSLNIAWQFYSGQAITLPEGKYPIPMVTSVVGGDIETAQSHLNYAHTYAGKNKYRMEAYHRLDVGMNYEVYHRNYKSIWNFGVYNLYNRMNASFYEFYIFDGKLYLYKYTMLPFFPSISYTIIF